MTNRLPSPLIRIFGTVLCGFALGIAASPTQASEASTHFALLVPANNDNNGRHSALTITAHAEGTVVTVTDTDEDGDSDDSTTAVLAKGQSIIVRIRDGAVNDDAGGKWDGDRIIVDATKPVTAMLSTRSYWQHDWVPAEGHTMRGQEFFMHSWLNKWDIDVVAYDDDTLVEVYRVTTAAKSDSGVTNVQLPGSLVLRQRLDRGEDLQVSKSGAGQDVAAEGHTYRVVTSRPATTLFGSVAGGSLRDGGGFVPSATGSTVGREFFFYAPAERWAPHEREIRIVASDKPSTVTLLGWDGSSYTTIATSNLQPFGHADFTGRTHKGVKARQLFQIVASEPVAVFEANWLETGSPGTSDVYSFLSALDTNGASDVGREFIAYLGPPGHETRVAGVNGTFSHLFIAGFTPGTNVTLTDADTGGSLFSRQVVLSESDEIVDVQLTLAEYESMNDSAASRRPYIRISSTEPISAASNNWNDNWLSFASGVLPPELEVLVEPPAAINCGQSAQFAITVTNIGSRDLGAVELDPEPVGGFQITTGPSPIASLDAQASTQRSLEGTVGCGSATEGALVGVSVVASTGTGTNNEPESATKNTSAAPLRVTGGVGIPEVVSREDGCAVELSWTTENDDGNVEYAVFRRQLDESTSYAEIGRVQSLAPATSGFVYGFRDNTAQQETRYQYVVRALTSDTGSEVAFGGPTLGTPGDPFTSPPGHTGDLVADFDSAGVQIVDTTGDVKSAAGVSPGYDVDRFAVAYDLVNDDLYLGVSAVGIFGDGDGDGDPDTSSTGSSGLVDRSRFAVDENFAFVLDLDGDGTEDSIVGIPLGGDIDYLQATQLNAKLASSPLLAFAPAPAEISEKVFVEILNYSTSSAPDMELVVHNISALSPAKSISKMTVRFYMAALSYADETESVPDDGVASIDADQVVTAGCGVPTDQFRLGMFAVFGNIFTGTPGFDFAPFGWSDGNSGKLLAPAPQPVAGQVVTSPTVFVGDKHVDIVGELATGVLDDLPEKVVHVKDEGFVSGTDFVHHTEVKYEFSESHGKSRYENIDLQVFRLFVLDCSAKVTITQRGTSGVLMDDRAVRLSDGSVKVLKNPFNPALTLAHSGIGTFETGGAMRQLFYGAPEDWVDDFGSKTSSDFTPYAFLDDITYVNTGDTPTDLQTYPLGAGGFELPAGVWFINHYLWTYANSGATEIETRFTPGANCGGKL